MPSPLIKIEVRSEQFVIDEEIAELLAGRTDIGAVTSFTGICRSEGDSLKALEIEHYPAMAEREIDHYVRIAIDRWNLDGVIAIHRYGTIAPGEQIVLVIAASKHRQASFDGANFIMDFLKTRAPFWKKEHLKDGNTGEWVSAKDEDDDALTKWE